MKTFNLYCFLIFFLLAFSNCKKEAGPKADNPYGLPNATEKGSMVFACRINGQNRIAKAGSISQGASISRDSVSAFGGFGTPSSYFESILLQVYGRVNLNIPYDLNDTIKTKFFYDTDSSCFGISSDVVKVYRAIGTVTFTKIDSVKKIISGTFLFRLPIPDCDTLNFTDGRFYISY
jgi:hypothetical protein